MKPVCVCHACDTTKKTNKTNKKHKVCLKNFHILLIINHACETTTDKIYILQILLQ